MRVLFMGTPDFAVPSLRGLVASGHQVVGVITQPDRPKGRGGTVTPPPVKAAALALGLPVHQPEKVNDWVEEIRQLQPEVGIVVAFGQILAPAILTIPPHGMINVHASLLPRYRGPAPINWAIIRGEKETGITTIFMDAGVDTGDIILQKAIAIGPDATAGQLEAELAELGAQVLVRTMDLVGRGEAPRRPQLGEPSYAPLVNRYQARIDWTQPAAAVVNLVRGMNPRPGAYTTWQGQPLKIWRAAVTGMWSELPPGTVVQADASLLGVATGSGEVLAIVELQPAGKKSMEAPAFLRGHLVKVGEVFA